jgi:hypothetical protein
METSDKIPQETAADTNGAFDIARLLFERANTPEIRLHPALRNLAACYRKAQKEPLARIPSYLEAAIENVVAMLPKPAPRAAWERDQQGAYDMSPRGGMMRPGS